MNAGNRARYITVAIALAICGSWSGARAQSEHRFGVGVHYWESVKDLAKKGLPDIEDSGLSWSLIYLYKPAGLISFELDMEYFPDGFGGANDWALSPQIFGLVGNNLYGGVGIGKTYADGFFRKDGSKDEDRTWSDLFYAARVGYRGALLPRTYLDLNLNYRANAFDELDGADASSVTAGASVTFRLN